MSLIGLGRGDGLQNIGNLYEILINTLSKMMKELCRVVKMHLQLVFVQTSDES